jgi:hypothetical protein
MHPDWRRSTDTTRKGLRKLRPQASTACVAFGEEVMHLPVHYQANFCGGDFQHVQECFDQWKQQPVVRRQGRTMFEGKREVRRLGGGRVFDSSELAHRALALTCSPHDPYALAAEIRDRGRDMWLVMASYDD